MAAEVVSARSGDENAPMRAYLDNSATTPLDPRVLAAMEPYWSETFGNAASLHAFGRDAEDAAATVREVVARHLGARPEEILFTSGGTESDNLALRGVIAAHPARRPHLAVSAIEHPAVLRTAEALAREGACEVTRIPVDGDGIVDPDAVRVVLGEETALVSVMAVNNETGAVQPVAEIAALCREAGATYHCDAVQATGKAPLPPDAADLITLSAHKVHGPRGIGVLRVRRGVRLVPILHGGEQQRGLRPGTVPVPLVVGLGEAVRLLGEEEEERLRHVERLARRMLTGLRERVEGVRLNGADGPGRVPTS
jgi:cysteine desulfurase